MCVHVRARVYVCEVRVCVHDCVCAYAHTRVSVRAPKSVSVFVCVCMCVHVCDDM